MTILVTGGAGYIGSHTCVELLEAGYDVVVADNLVNASPKALDAVTAITGKKPRFYQIDVADEAALRGVFQKENINAVIHFAALKAVGESVSKPIAYYENNLRCTLNLCKVMDAFDVRKFVFSSSATVYGAPATVPITEDFPLSATNPYGYTKLMGEQILLDIAHSDPRWSVVILRYFNPIGAHKSGLIGEDPAGIPNNLVPYIAQVASGKLDYVRVFGNDYPTKDGTGVRDYIHVVDLAQGHIKAIDKMNAPGVQIYNLGTGTGYSVLEVIDCFSKACGQQIPYQIIARRPGDIAECYANPAKAKTELGWAAQYGIAQMCEDTWNWQSKNPNGFNN